MQRLTKIRGVLAILSLGFVMKVSAQFFYVDWGGDYSIRRIETNGVANSIILDALFQVNRPDHLTAPQATRTIYFLDYDQFGRTHLKRANFDGSGLSEVIGPEPFEAFGVNGFDRYFVDGVNGSIYYHALHQNGPGVLRSDLSGANLKIATPFGSPVFTKGVYFFFVDAGEGKIYVEANGSVVRSNLDGSAPQTVLVAGYNPGTCAFTGDGKIVLPTDFNSPVLAEINTDGTGRKSIHLPIDGFRASHGVESIRSIRDLTYEHVTKRFFVFAYAIRSTPTAQNERILGVFSFDRQFSSQSATLVYIFPEERSANLVNSEFSVGSWPTEAEPEDPIVLSPFLTFGITLQTKQGVQYLIQSADRLGGGTGGWTTLRTVEGDGQAITIFDKEAFRDSQKIFRAVTN
ncbi:MAG: hypothetical protein JNL10_14885 [Verrucomicrobiales bacterium]|nr:hypothetical protein [Verrucomicrobiales bacterium]